MDLLEDIWRERESASERKREREIERERESERQSSCKRLFVEVKDFA